MNADNNADEDGYLEISALPENIEMVEEEGSSSNQRTTSTQWPDPPSVFRYGSYDGMFRDECILPRRYCMILRNASNSNAGDGRGAFLRELFQKELTPSDVGKLNRLVIPKKYAVQYFPPILRPGNKGREGDGSSEGMILEFKDRHGRVWNFRYCYWKSSHSFVFTKGWNKFVKANELTTHDTVLFYRFEQYYNVGEDIATKDYYFLIDIRRTCQEDGGGGGIFRQVPESAVEIGPAKEGGGDEEEEVKNGFKLFGVHIAPINI